MAINKIILLVCMFMGATMAYKIPHGISRGETISVKREMNERSEEKTEDLPELSSRTVESSDDEEDSFINDMLRIDERYSKGSSTVESSNDEEDTLMDDMLQTSQSYGKSSSTVKSQDDEEDSVLDDMLQVDQSHRKSASSVESSDDEDDSFVDDMLRQTDESYSKGSSKLKSTDDNVHSLTDDMLQPDEHDKKRPRLSHYPAGVALDENQLEPYCHSQESSIGNDKIPPWIWDDGKLYINFYRPQKEVKCNAPSGSNSIMIDNEPHQICNAVSNCFEQTKNVEVRFYSILPFGKKVKTYSLDLGCKCMRTENIGVR